MSSKLDKIDRRDFLGTAGAALAATLIAGESRAFSFNKAVNDMLVYVGTYTSGGAEGIYVLKLDLGSGELTKVATVKDVVEPSYLTTDGRNRFLYAVNETNEFEGKPSGAVSAFSIEKDGSLKFINKVPSFGASPCHVIVSANDKFVLVANYMGGNLVVFPVRPDGGLGQYVELKQDHGSGPNKDRQEAAHAHSVYLDSKNKFALSADLGIDRVMIYKFDEATGKLTPNAIPFYSTKPGAGPRHLAFHPEGKFVYIINELDCTITGAAYDAKVGELKEIQTTTTLPSGFSGENTCAEIALSPNGKFLYASNRGHDSIASYSVDKTTGKLAYIEHVLTGGKTPRNFTIDPGGKYLLAANQNSGSIVVFNIDQSSGRLKASGKKIDIPAPVCLRIIPAPGK